MEYRIGPGIHIFHLAVYMYRYICTCGDSANSQGFAFERGKGFERRQQDREQKRRNRKPPPAPCYDKMVWDAEYAEWI
jgi:hypothetical protein